MVACGRKVACPWWLVVAAVFATTVSASSPLKLRILAWPSLKGSKPRLLSSVLNVLRLPGSSPACLANSVQDANSSAVASYLYLFPGSASHASSSHCPIRS